MMGSRGVWAEPPTDLRLNEGRCWLLVKALQQLRSIGSSWFVIFFFSNPGLGACEGSQICSWKCFSCFRWIGQPESDDHKRHKSHKKIDVMKDIDVVPSNVQSVRQEALLYVFEDNEAVIKMIIKGRSPTLRHVSIGCLIESIWTPRFNTLTPKTNSHT